MNLIDLGGDIIFLAINEKQYFDEYFPNLNERDIKAWPKNLDRKTVTCELKLLDHKGRFVERNNQKEAKDQIANHVCGRHGFVGFKIKKSQWPQWVNFKSDGLSA